MTERLGPETLETELHRAILEAYQEAGTTPHTSSTKLSRAQTLLDLHVDARKTRDEKTVIP